MGSNPSKNKSKDDAPAPKKGSMASSAPSAPPSKKQAAKEEKQQQKVSNHPNISSYHDELMPPPTPILTSGGLGEQPRDATLSVPPTCAWAPWPCGCLVQHQMAGSLPPKCG